MQMLYEYPFTPRYCQVNGGHKMAYLDEGKGPVIVCVHGNPTWSYMYRRVVAELSEQYRLIVPDHIGCGFSDKPQEYQYTLATHIDNLTILLESLDITECILMVHDWGGAIGMGWAGKNPQKIKGMIVCNTAAFRSKRIPLRIAVCRIPYLGDVLVRGLNGFARAALFMAVAEKMQQNRAKGFLAPYDSWHNRIALLRFVQDIPLRSGHSSWQTLVAVEESLKNLQEHPMLLCWGGKDFCFTRHFYKEWQRRFPHAESNYFPGASHYLLEDAFEEIMTLVTRFIQKIDTKNE